MLASTLNAVLVGVGGVAGVGVISAIFYAVGRSEDRERDRR